MNGRWVHDAGDCRAGCDYCAQESRDARPPTPQELADIRAAIQAAPRPSRPEPQRLTDAESAAIARAKLDKARKP